MERHKKLKTLNQVLIALVFLLLGSSAELRAQGPVPQAPNCYRSFAFTTTGQTTFISNYGPGSPDGGSTCTEWILAYAVQNTGGSVTGLNLVVQSAPPGTGETVPGSWVTYAGTVSVGVNPNTSTTGAQTILLNNTTSIPFIRVALTSLTATGTTIVFGTLQGWSLGNGGGSGGGGSGCVGTSVTPCVVDGPTSPGTPPAFPGVDAQAFDGTNAQRLKSDNQGRLLPGAYPSSVAISLTTSGLTQVIAASGSTVITLGSYSISFASSVDFQWEYGTGSNCGTGTTALTGVYKSILTIAVDDPIEVPSGKALCANLGASVVGGGVGMYNQQ